MVAKQGQPKAGHKKAQKHKGKALRIRLDCEAVFYNVVTDTEALEFHYYICAGGTNRL